MRNEETIEHFKRERNQFARSLHSRVQNAKMLNVDALLWMVNDSFEKCYGSQSEKERRTGI